MDEDEDPGTAHLTEYLHAVTGWDEARCARIAGFLTEVSNDEWSGEQE
jgi:hypothetical protein